LPTLPAAGRQRPAPWRWPAALLLLLALSTAAGAAEPGAALDPEKVELVSPLLMAEKTRPQLEDGLPYKERGVPPGLAGKKAVFLPIPMIGTSPNKGVDLGILPVWLLFNDNGCVRYIIAPSIDYNTEQGLIFTGRLFSYPTPTRKWFAIAERSLEVRQNYEAFYEDYTCCQGSYYLRTWAWFQDDPTARFWGFGPKSKKKEESGYTLREVYGEAFFGWNVESWRFLLSERLRYVAVQNQGFSGIPFTGAEFPSVPGLSGSFNAAHGVAVVYDDRDHPDIPSCGRYGQLWAEASLDPLSDDTFGRYGVEWRHYVPWPSERFITAYQLLYTAVTDSDIPFYEQPALGGEDFRGFPEGRFVGRGKWQVNLEERIRVLRMHMFDVDFDVEVAPFVGLGQVFEDEEEAASHVQPIGGVGFRAVVKPQVVGKVDIGYGGEGMNIYVSLNYPF
jgi:hypothetical protein